MKVNLDEALNLLDQMREADSDEGVANALMRVAVAMLDRGKAEMALEHLDEAHYYCQRLDNQEGRAQVCLRQAQAEHQLGRFEAAEAKLREAMDIFVAGEHVMGRVNTLERLAQVLADAGRDGEAIACLEEALDLVGPQGDPVARVLLSQYLAPLQRRQGLLEQALDTYIRMGSLAQELGDMQRVGLALVGAGGMQAQLRRKTSAFKNLEQAERLFKELGQAGLAQQVQAQLAVLAGETDASGGPEGGLT